MDPSIACDPRRRRWALQWRCPTLAASTRCDVSLGGKGERGSGPGGHTSVQCVCAMGYAWLWPNARKHDSSAPCMQVYMGLRGEIEPPEFQGKIGSTLHLYTTGEPFPSPALELHTHPSSNT